MAVMQFVGVEHDELAGQGLARGAAIIETLHAAKGQTERVDIVAMGREGGAPEAGLESPDAVTILTLTHFRSRSAATLLL